ncbi:MAG TPA: DUF3667 domain-containing protein, partial [Flavisolibacter sp.]|nr:DUF3667 domain-containing protein [Flavisolibacter sp.]
YLFTRPGKLSELYCAGVRKSLFKPLSLFFLLVVLYLLFPVFEGISMKLMYHMQSNYYGNYALEKATAVMQKNNWSQTQLSEAFQLKSAKVSKFLLLILIPLTALFCWVFTFKKRGYFFDQMVLASEINSVYLIWGFLLVPLLVFSFQIIYKAVAGAHAQVTDNEIGPLMYAVLLLYVNIAGRRFYKLKMGQAVGFALLFCIAHTVIVHGIYKFLLFSIIMLLL